MTQREFLQLVAENYPGIEARLPFYCSCYSPCFPTPQPISPSATPTYAFLTASTPLTAVAGNGIAFTVRNTSGDIFVSGDTITLHTPGVYAVTYNLNLPYATTLSTQLTLQLNGARVAGTQVHVNKTDAASSNTVFGQAILTVPTAPATLRLISSAAINIPVESNADILATMNIIRL